MSSLIINNLEVSYFDEKTKVETTAISNVSMELHSGQLYFLLGGSGSGKTTLLKAIAGLLDSDGDLLLDGEDFSIIPFSKRKLSYVSQDLFLFPKLTIYDNIAFPLKINKYARIEVDKKVKNLAYDFGIYHCLSRLPKHLSLGQAQRAILAKSLAKDPNILLLDEFTSHLDPQNAKEILEHVKKYTIEHNCIALIVSHQIRDALEFGDYIYILDDGTISDFGTIEQITNSKNRNTIELLNNPYAKD